MEYWVTESEPISPPLQYSITPFPLLQRFIDGRHEFCLGHRADDLFFNRAAFEDD